jgi:lipopolysaccharide/colanic/teichoic acid biosynthesis glycosyltransferase
MKNKNLAKDFLESFGTTAPPKLSTQIDPNIDPTLGWISRHDRRHIIRNERSLDVLTRIAMRLFDIVVAALALVVLSPVLLILAIAIRIESPGPVIYTQKRTGLNLRSVDRRAFGNVRRLTGLGGADWQDGINPSAAVDSIRRRIPDRRRVDRRSEAEPGRPVMIYKFRSMVCDAEKDGIRMATKGDARITRVGRFIRRTRLDEIPQFLNVLKGEMSIVGPRPERPEIVDYLEEQIPGYRDRLGVRPGITGLAQIRNGYDTDLAHIRRKITLDNYYIQKCSLWNDIKILLRTVKVVIKGEGAM